MDKQKRLSMMRAVKIHEQIKPIPKKVVNWTVKNMTGYLMYQVMDKKHYRIRCTSCLHDEIVEKTAFAGLTKGASCECPKCKRELHGKNWRYDVAEKTVVSYFDKAKDGSLMLNSYMVYLTIGEDKARHITVTPYVYTSFATESPISVDITAEGVLESFHSVYAGNLMYPGNLDTVLKGTPLEYAQIKEMAAWEKKTHPDEKVVWKRYIANAYQSPALEWLVKVGAQEFIHEDLMRDHYWWNYSYKLNYSENTIHEILRLTRAEYHMILKEDHTIDCDLRRLMVGLEGFRENMSLEEMKELVNNGFLEIKDRISRSRYRDSRIKPMTLLNYLKKQTDKCHFEKLQDAGIYWNDMYTMLNELGYCMTDKGTLYPPDLRHAHDKAIEERERKKEEAKKAKNKELAKQMKKLEQAFFKSIQECKTVNSIMHGKEFVVMPLFDPELLENEGRVLHHCVGSYKENVANGKTMIFAIRKASKPEKPYVTFEYKDGRIIQCRAERNMEPTVKARSVADRFAKAMRKVAV